jgi:hypothetical protein
MNPFHPLFKQSRSALWNLSVTDALQMVLCPLSLLFCDNYSFNAGPQGMLRSVGLQFVSAPTASNAYIFKALRIY